MELVSQEELWLKITTKSAKIRRVLASPNLMESTVARPVKDQVKL